MARRPVVVFTQVRAGIRKGIHFFPVFSVPACDECDPLQWRGGSTFTYLENRARRPSWGRDSTFRALLQC